MSRGPRHGRFANEKAKDFKGTMKTLILYLVMVYILL